MDWQKLSDEIRGVKIRSSHGFTYTATGDAHIIMQGKKGHVSAQLSDLAASKYQTLGKEERVDEPTRNP